MKIGEEKSNELGTCCFLLAGLEPKQAEELSEELSKLFRKYVDKEKHLGFNLNCTNDLGITMMDFNRFMMALTDDCRYPGDDEDSHLQFAEAVRKAKETLGR